MGTLLAQMTPSNVRVDVQTSSFSSMAGADTQQEPWFGVPYVSSPISPALLTQWGSTPPSPELQLPPKNDFIPTDFSLRSDDTATASTSKSSEPAASMRTTRSQQQQHQGNKVAQVGQKHAHNGSAVSNGHADEAPEHSSFPTPPEMIYDEPGLRLWHKLDRQFQTPKAAAYFSLTSAAMYESPAAAAATHLLMKLLEDALCETAYLADVAGLSYDVSVDLKLAWQSCMAGLHAHGSLICGMVANVGQCLGSLHEHVCCTIATAQAVQDPSPIMHISKNGAQPLRNHFAYLCTSLCVTNALHCSAFYGAYASGSQ